MLEEETNLLNSDEPVIISKWNKWSPIINWSLNIIVLLFATIDALFICLYYRPCFVDAGHIWLSILYIPLLALGIQVNGNNGGLSLNLERRTNYILYGLLVFAGFTIIVIGTEHTTLFLNSSLSTLHSKAGLASMILLLLSFIFGLFSIKTIPLKYVPRVEWFELLHNALGVFGFLVGILSLILGFVPYFQHIHTRKTEMWAAIVSTSSVTLFIIYGPVISSYNKFRELLK